VCVSYASLLHTFRTGNMDVVERALRTVASTLQGHLDPSLAASCDGGDVLAKATLSFLAFSCLFVFVRVAVVPR
jgi:hypothetical protein